MKFKSDTLRKSALKILPRRMAKNIVTKVFGFPVKLSKAAQIRFEGEWVLDVDYDQLSEELIEFLLDSHRPLTGSQMRFLRKSLGLTQERLAKRLGKDQPHIARAEGKGNEIAFESYSDQFTLISHLKVERARQLKERDSDWVDEIISAEDFSEDPIAEVTLRSA